MMGLIMNGGLVMAILLGLSVTALAIILQKILILKATKVPDNFVHSVKARLATEGKDALIKQMAHADHLAEKIAAKSLEKFGSSDASIAAEITEVTKQDIQKLSTKMNLLSMIITTSPVLGLLGTVLGLMDVFSVIAVEGAGHAELLSMGISKALVTTVAGLSLAIPLMFVHQYLSSKIDECMDQWNAIPNQLLAFLNDRNHQ